MFGAPAFHQLSDTRVPLRVEKLVGSHVPTQNHLLAALPRRDYERLLPDLEPASLPLGWTVHGPGDYETYLYFLTAGIVSRSYVTAAGHRQDSQSQVAKA